MRFFQMDAPPDNDAGLRTFYGYTRIVILLLTMAVLTTALSNNIIINFTVICMDDIVPVDYDNSTGINICFRTMQKCVSNEPTQRWLALQLQVERQERVAFEKLRNSPPETQKTERERERGACYLIMFFTSQLQN